MAKVVLLHGAWYGSWSWGEVKDILIDNGYQVYTPDYPKANEKKNITISDFLDVVRPILKQANYKEVILVGHSISGVILRELEKEFDDKIAAYLYIAAFYLKENSVKSHIRKYRVGIHIGPNKVELMINNQRVVGLKDEISAKKKLMHDVKNTPSFTSKMVSNPIPYSIFSHFVAIRKEKNNENQYYLGCKKDRAIPIKEQKKMCKDFAEKNIRFINSSHSVQLSKPNSVVAFIEYIYSIHF